MIDEKQSRQDLGLACAVIHSRFIRKKSVSSKFIELCTKTPNRKNCLESSRALSSLHFNGKQRINLLV